MSTDDMIRFMRQRCSVPPRSFIVDLAKSHGSYLATSEGELLDLACFHGSRLIGYNHPHMLTPGVQAALIVAATTKPANPDFVTPELYRYYRMLDDIAPDCIKGQHMRTLVVNSGAEAVENALKHCIAKTGGTYTISFNDGFHGRTVFALANTSMPHNPAAHVTFETFAATSIKCKPPKNDAEVMRAIEHVDTVIRSRSDRCAAVIIEPVQGAGGHNVIPATFMRALNTLCHAKDVPLIVDEVQTGGGGAGTMWMSDLHRLQFPPECIVGGKRLGCGVVYMHTPASLGLLDTTWGGTLSDMVRVCEEMKVVQQEDLMSQVRMKHVAFMRHLTSFSSTHPELVSSPRGHGLLLGFDVGSRLLRDRLVSLCQQNSLLVLPAGTHAVRFRPSLGITLADIGEAMSRLRSALDAARGGA